MRKEDIFKTIKEKTIVWSLFALVLFFGATFFEALFLPFQIDLDQDLSFQDLLFFPHIFYYIAVMVGWFFVVGWKKKWRGESEIFLTGVIFFTLINLYIIWKAYTVHGVYFDSVGVWILRTLGLI